MPSSCASAARHGELDPGRDTGCRLRGRMVISRAMSSRSRPRTRHAPFRTAEVVAVIAVAIGGAALADCSRQSAAQRTADQGRALYAQGKYAEALPLLQKARDAGLGDGTLLYQIGYCREVVEGKADARKEIWREAEAALAKEVAAPEGATVERLYELTVIASDRGDFESMTRLARQAVDRHEKGPDPNALAGEDWFRLGRLHDFLSEASEAEAAYRRGV